MSLGIIYLLYTRYVGQLSCCVLCPQAVGAIFDLSVAAHTDTPTNNMRYRQIEPRAAGAPRMDVVAITPSQLSC